VGEVNLSIGSHIYEGVARYVKGEVYVEGIIYGAFDGKLVDGDRITMHRLRSAWVGSDGIGGIDSQGNEFIMIDFDETHPSVMDSLHLLFALALLGNGSPDNA